MKIVKAIVVCIALMVGVAQAREAVDASVAESITTPPVTDATGIVAVMPHDLSPLGMYQAADWVVKSVMLLLLAASVLTWSVWIFKLIELHRARVRSKALLQRLVNSESFLEQISNPGTPLLQTSGDGLFLLEATAQELKLSMAGPATDEGIKERVAARLDRIQLAAASKMNLGTGILATIGSVAPFVGLFGTVWGIMNSFIGIARSQTTNLAVVAPGIAEALLATAVGLVAAIPAVVIYNHFARAIGAYKALLADIATALLVLVSRDLDRVNPASRTLKPATSATATKDAA